MSGIAGWADYTSRLAQEKDTIKTMVGKLSRSAQSSDGFWASEHMLLGSGEKARVPGGEQPVICKRGDAMVVLVYSGELYNTEELISELAQKGHRFEARDDARAILHAYMEWGEAFLKKLRGVFALALRDAENERLIIARDRLGVKPLFYHRAKEALIFASEIKSLLAHPYITPRLGPEGLAEVFAIGPARTPGHGVFSGIYELKPGHFMVMERSGLRIKRYWSLTSWQHEESFDETASSVRELVMDAVRRQVNAGGKTAFLLSGGLDSSAICAIAANETDTPLRTFSLDYVDNEKNFRASAFQPNTDAPWVKAVSEYLKSTHETCLLDTPELTEAIFASVYARDLPGMTDIDSSLLLFSRYLRDKAGVGITGECADELFGGYPWFYRPQERDTFPWAQRLSERVKLYTPELSELIKPEEYVAARYEEALSEIPYYGDETPEEKNARRLSYLTLTRWLPTLLERQDRMSTYAGIVLRAPFSDHRLLEYMWNVPWTMKYRHNREKGLLRHALRGLLPDDVLWRKKSPFPKTHNPDYIARLRAMTLAMLDGSASPLHRLIDTQQVRQLAETMTRDTDIPWFGQLMNAPQLLAYLLQVDFWFREYNIAV